MSDAFSFRPYCVAIWIDPCCINTRNADTRIMANGLNFDIHATIMAVNPRPPAVLVEMVWLAPLTMIAPDNPRILPEHNTERYDLHGNVIEH